MDKKNSKLAIETLKYYKRLIWPEVKRYLKSPKFPSAFQISSRYKPLEKFHWKLTNEYPLRMGKYIRPTLLMLTTCALGKNAKLALKTAVAMQISEEWMLIHDDIEDQSLLRRGKPTLHRLFGNELAINAGDVLHAIMWKKLFENISILGKEKTEKIFNEFYSMIMRTALGQTIEIKWKKENKLKIEDEDYYFITDGNSVYYSIVGPIRLGAIIADATSEQLKILTEFGFELGRCWQLVDDILDVTTDFKGLKQQGNDILENKRTILLGHLLRTIVGRDKKRLLSILNKQRDEKTKGDVSWVIEKMNKLGSVGYARKLAQVYEKKANEIFEKKLTFVYRKPQKDQLKSLVHFILAREY